MKFQYTARRKDQSTITAEIEASSEKEAIQTLELQNLIILNLTTTHDKTKTASMQTKIPSKKNVQNFTEQLSSLLSAGVSLLQSIEVLYQQTTDVRMKDLVRSVLSDLKDGQSLSQSLAHHPKVFSNFYVNMIKSGELSGTLEQVLVRLTEFYEKEQEIRSKIQAALTYPLFVSLVGLGTISVLILFIVPRITNIFTESGQALPFITQLLLGISAFFCQFWWIIGILLIGLYLILKRQLAVKNGRWYIHNLYLRIPVIGLLHRDDEISKFTRSLAILMQNGLPMLNALEIAKNIAQSEVLAQELESMIDSVRQGRRLTDSLVKTKFFPMSAVNMLAVGEASGHLEIALDKISKSYERIVERRVRTTTALLEPVLIVILGLIVASIVFAMLMPILQINMIAI